MHNVVNRLPYITNIGTRFIMHYFLSLSSELILVFQLITAMDVTTEPGTTARSTTEIGTTGIYSTEIIVHETIIDNY